MNDHQQQNEYDAAASLLDSIEIVMVQTSHPGNIGAAARAMKTMGLSRLTLVAPKVFPDEQATAMASGADDVLQHAQVVADLPTAVKACQYVIGTSARSQRSLAVPLFDARECAAFIRLTYDRYKKSQFAKPHEGGQVSSSVEHFAQTDANKHPPPQSTLRVAIVFGRESTGLTNDELDYCQYLVHIPTNPRYNSLNIAAAVQIISYECTLAAHQYSVNLANDTLDEHQSCMKDKQKIGQKAETDDPIVDMQAMEAFYQHLESTLIAIRYLDPDNPRYLLRRLRRLFGRVHLTRTEMNILRGILAAIGGRKFQARVKTKD
ncbi:MAG: RNA methyltransferase [bacterium]